ncbi:MAG: AEC family transporter [Clostridia bacterium]|nr:AEC family transporter [Clostridia bacterium]
MDALLPMLINVLIFVALALPGYILVKTKIIKSSDSASLSKLLTYVALPFMIFVGAQNINLSGDFLALAGITTVAGIAITVGCFFLSKPLAMKRLFNKNSNNETESEETVNTEKSRGVMRFAMAFSNNGFLGIPLAVAVFSGNAQIQAIVIILNIITNLFLYTLGIYLISGDKNMISIKKALLNPVLIAFVLGIIFNAFGIAKAVPEVTKYATHLNNLVTPISMIILGIKLADIPLKSLFTSPLAYYVSAIKLVLVPLLAVLIAVALKALFNLSNDIIMGFFIGFAMPTAGLASTFADNYNGDTKNAVIYTLSSTILSVITIPLLYLLLTAIL